MQRASNAAGALSTGSGVTDQGGAWLLRAEAAEGAMADVSTDVQVWDAFDAEGVFLGPIRVPANILLIQLIGQSALTIVYDEMDRASVAIYEVRWMASPVAETRVRGSQRRSQGAAAGARPDELQNDNPR